MKKILVLLVMLLMVGCEAKESEKPKQIIRETVKQSAMKKICQWLVMVPWSLSHCLVSLHWLLLVQ